MDAAAPAGIDFTHTNGASGRYYYPETNGSGCALFDADGDGWLDVLLVNGAPLPGCPPGVRSTPTLYLNNRDGTFRNATTGTGLDTQFYGTGCCVGDYDNDGRPDLYIAAVLGPGHLFHNRGQGRFEDVTARAGVGNAGHWGTACAWLDYDRDGRLDLFVGNYVRYRLGSDEACLYAEGYKTYCGPKWYSPDSPCLYRNLGDGRFADVSAAAGLKRVKGKALGVVPLDANGDGWPDLFVTNDVWENHLLQNAAHGTGRGFQEVGVQRGVALSESGKMLAGMGVDAADLLGDDRLWVATANFSGEGVAVFRQDIAGGGFADVSQQVGVTQATINTLGFGIVWIDTANRGTPDLLVANGHVSPEVHQHQPHLRYEEPKRLLEWDGAGRFQDVTARAGDALERAVVSRGMAIGDYDNDGRLDVLVNNVAGRAQLLHNVRATGNHWIGLQLEGRRSNRSGYGAVVTIRAGGRRFRAFCRSGGSYGSASDPRVHIGLGAQANVEEVAIRWPSGVTQALHGLAVDRYHHIVESP